MQLLVQLLLLTSCPTWLLPTGLLQIERPLAKDDFSKLLQKTLGVRLAPAVLDIVFAVFGDSEGLLDGPAFVQVMKSRNRVPGYRVRQSID